MSIQIYCDGKNCRSTDMKIFYCEDCYGALQDSLDEANDRIAELEQENEKLQLQAE